MNARTTSVFERVLLRFCERRKPNVTELTNHFNITHEEAINIIKWERLNPKSNFETIDL